MEDGSGDCAVGDGPPKALTGEPGVEPDGVPRVVTGLVAGVVTVAAGGGVEVNMIGVVPTFVGAVLKMGGKIADADDVIEIHKPIPARVLHHHFLLSSLIPNIGAPLP